MIKFTVTFEDGVGISIEAVDGAQAKQIARVKRGLKKSECKITSVAPTAEPTPGPEVASDTPKAEVQS